MSERISRDEMLLHIAIVTAGRGTCSRLKVGVVFSREGRIVVNGYNGAPRGLPHCNHTMADTKCENAEHAERNAIAFAARHGLALEGTEVHCTHAPCLDCARALINVGITKLTYEKEYRLTEGLSLLRSVGIPCIQVD